VNKTANVRTFTFLWMGFTQKTRKAKELTDQLNDEHMPARQIQKKRIKEIEVTSGLKPSVERKEQNKIMDAGLNGRFWHFHMTLAN